MVSTTSMVFIEKKLNTSPNSSESPCLSAFPMVRCSFITSPHTSPVPPPYIASYALLQRWEASPPTHCVNVGGHASQRDTCRRYRLSFRGFCDFCVTFSPSFRPAEFKFGCCEAWIVNPHFFYGRMSCCGRNASLYLPLSPLPLGEAVRDSLVVRCLVRCLVRCSANTSPSEPRCSKGFSRILVRC